MAKRNPRDPRAQRLSQAVRFVTTCRPNWHASNVDRADSENVEDEERDGGLRSGGLAEARPEAIEVGAALLVERDDFTVQQEPGGAQSLRPPSRCSGGFARATTGPLPGSASAIAYAAGTSHIASAPPSAASARGRRGVRTHGSRRVPTLRVCSPYGDPPATTTAPSQGLRQIDHKARLSGSLFHRERAVTARGNA